MRAVLHIGLPKTGTTTVQSFMLRNRGALEKQGWFYDRTGPSEIHAEYAVIANELNGAMTANFVARHHCRVKTRQDQVRLLKQVQQKLQKHGSAHPDSTWLISCETLGAMNKGGVYYRKLLNWLNKFFDDVIVIVYIREQTAWIESGYKQYLVRSGIKDLNEYVATRTALNYNRFVRRLERVFGAEKVHVRLFDRKVMVDGDVVADFCHTLGISRDGMVPVADKNLTLPANKLRLLRKANRLLLQLRPGLSPYSMASRIARKSIRVMPSLSSAKLELSPDTARRIQRRVARSNEALRQRRFPERDTLFNIKTSDIDRSDAKTVSGNVATTRTNNQEP